MHIVNAFFPTLLHSISPAVSFSFSSQSTLTSMVTSSQGRMNIGGADVVTSLPVNDKQPPSEPGAWGLCSPHPVLGRGHAACQSWEKVTAPLAGTGTCEFMCPGPGKGCCQLAAASLGFGVHEFTCPGPGRRRPHPLWGMQVHVPGSW